MIEYPRHGVWTLGFVTGTVSDSLQSHLSKPMLSIFIPTTPNPTSGWYAIVPEDEVINLSLSIEEAFKVLISGGIVNPNNAQGIMAMSKPERKLTPENSLSELVEEKPKILSLEEDN